MRSLVTLAVAVMNRLRYPQKFSARIERDLMAALQRLEAIGA